MHAERKRHLAYRLGSLGVVAGVLVAIWALTDPGLPWIAWPLLALGLIGGLDAWHVYSVPPLSEADIAEGDDRGDAIAHVTKRRRLRHHIGAHAILNVFIVGVWVAASGTYFWPAWVMLGSAITIALEVLPRGAGPGHRRALGSTSR